MKTLSIFILSMFLVTACTISVSEETALEQPNIEEVVLIQPNPNAQKELGEICYGDEECKSKRCVYLISDRKAHCSPPLQVNNELP